MHSTALKILATIIFFCHFSLYPQTHAFKPWHQDAFIKKQKVSKIIQARKSNVLKDTSNLLLVFYQSFFSSQDGSVCRFNPTCSRFSKLAIKKYGFFKGLFLTSDRLIRDNPFVSPPKSDFP